MARRRASGPDAPEVRHPRGPMWLAYVVLFAAALGSGLPAAAQTRPGAVSGTMYWSAATELAWDGTQLDVGIPEVTARVDLVYEQATHDRVVRLRADARGTWGARLGFNTEQNLATSLRLVEASVTWVNPWGEWTIGRHPMLLPFQPDDYRRFGLLVGNPSAPADGVSWYRPVGRWDLEAALAYIHVLRDPFTGRLEKGDVWLAARASSSSSGRNWRLDYAPTLLLSDAVDSHGAGLPVRLALGAHRFEGEVAVYNLTGTTLVPTGWYTAWVLRYEPPHGAFLRLDSIEAASLPPYFLPHMGSFGDRGGQLGWRPGEAGVVARFNTGPGLLSLAWRELQKLDPATGQLGPVDAWEVGLALRGLPEPLTSAGISLVRIGDSVQLTLNAGLGVRF